MWSQSDVLQLLPILHELVAMSLPDDPKVIAGSGASWQHMGYGRKLMPGLPWWTLRGLENLNLWFRAQITVVRVVRQRLMGVQGLPQQFRQLTCWSWDRTFADHVWASARIFSGLPTVAKGTTFSLATPQDFSHKILKKLKVLNASIRSF